MTKLLRVRNNLKTPCYGLDFCNRSTLRLNESTESNAQRVEILQCLDDYFKSVRSGIRSYEISLFLRSNFKSFSKIVCWVITTQQI